MKLFILKFLFGVKLFIFVVDLLFKFINDNYFGGEDFFFIVDLDVIVEVCCFDDLILDQGEWVIDIKEVDWIFVEQCCVQLIEICSKDLWLVVWYSEVVCKMCGLCGLGDGFLLVVGLFDQFWDYFYLLLEDGDYDCCVGNLIWLLLCLVQMLCEIFLIEGCGSVFFLFDFDVVCICVVNVEWIVNEGGQLEEGIKLVVMELVCKCSLYVFYEVMLVDI